MKIISKTINQVENDGSGQSLPDLGAAFLFSGLSGSDIEFFKSAGQTRSFKKGKILYIQEDKADFFFVIFRGWVKIFQTLVNGKDIIIEMATVGDTIGVDALFEHFTHSSNAQIVEDVDLLCIPLSVLKTHMLTKTQVAFNMFSALSQKNIRNRRDNSFHMHRRAPQRLAHFLLQHCPKEKEKNIIFYFPFDKTLVAHLLGMTRGSFSRALNALRQQNFIRIKGTRSVTCMNMGSGMVNCQ